MPGHRRAASRTGVPVRTPAAFASSEAATTDPAAASSAVTATGLPRSAGSICRSTLAKNESMST